MKVEIVNAKELASAYRRYAAIYGQRSGRGKTLDQILLERARKLAFELYEQTAAIAPTRAQIAADVQKLGWRIPKKFPDGRLGRGEPSQWLGNAVDELPKRRGRKTKKRLALEAGILSSKSTLQQMQAFVTRWRSGHTKFVASGWLGVIRDLGGVSTKKTTGNIKFGRAVVDKSGITLINDAPGCSEANAKHGFVRKAIDAQIKDMSDYIISRTQTARKAA